MPTMREDGLRPGACGPVAVLGGGLAGLAAARTLHQMGVDCTVFEAAPGVGGLARSRPVDGGAHDLGGGRFFVPKDETVNAWVFDLLPRERWQFERTAVGFRVDGREHRLPPLRYVVRGAGDLLRRRGPEPADLGAWLRWAYGPTLANRFLAPFCSKLWGVPLDQLEPAKEGGKLIVPGLVALPPLTWGQVARSLTGDRPRETTMAMGYPREGGMGALPEAIAAGLPSVRTGHAVERLARDGDGGWTVDGDGPFAQVIATIPLPALLAAMDDVPADVRDAVDGLRWVDMSSACFVGADDGSALPRLTFAFDRDVETHRVVRRRGSDGRVIAVLDRRGRVTGDDVRGDAQRLGLGELAGVHYEPFAYPIFDHGYGDRRRRALDFLERRGVIALGRWTWAHTSMDTTIAQALAEVRSRWGARSAATEEAADVR